MFDFEVLGKIYGVYFIIGGAGDVTCKNDETPKGWLGAHRIVTACVSLRKTIAARGTITSHILRRTSILTSFLLN